MNDDGQRRVCLHICEPRGTVDDYAYVRVHDDNFNGLSTALCMPVDLPQGILNNVSGEGKTYVTIIPLYSTIDD